MKKEQTLTIDEVGLPRANSNALFLSAIVLIGVFSVMTFSCSSNDKQTKQSPDSPTQPLTGNEWFVGKAQGLELPKPPAPKPPRLEPKVKPPRQVVKAPTKPPAKRLGGKILTTTSKVSPSVAQNHSSSELRDSPVQATKPDYYLERDVEQVISDFEIKAGTSIPAQLDITINSDLGGPAVAHITRTMYDTATGGFSLIPPGTKLYGNIDSRVSFGQTRVDVVWNRLIFPNGASLVVENLRASDRVGQTGLHHTVDNHFDRLFGGAILLSAISGGVQLSQPQTNTGFNAYPSIGETIAGSLGQNLGQVSTEFIRRQMDVRPTIVIPNGEHFTIIVNKDMVFPAPYGEW